MEYQQIPEIITDSEPEPDDQNDSDYVPVTSSESEEEPPKLKTGQSTLNALSKYQKANPDNEKKNARDVTNDLKPAPKDCKHLEQNGSKHNNQNNYKPFHIYFNLN
jgi:hypothetical protein